MPKGDRWEPGNPLQGGGMALREKGNGHDKVIKDHDDRIYDLEFPGGKGASWQTVNVCVNGSAGTMQVWAFGAVAT